MHLSTELNSTEMSFTGSDTPSEKYLDVSTCNPDLYSSPSKKPKSPPRGHISWLPPLRFQIPSPTRKHKLPPRGRISWLEPLKFLEPEESGHPALQRRPNLYSNLPKKTKSPPRGRITWLPPLRIQVPAENGHPAAHRRPEHQNPTRSQTNLLPASINHDPFPQNDAVAAHYSLECSETAAMSSSSLYSRSTSASTLIRGPSTISSFPSTLSSLSSKSRSSTIKCSSSSTPSVPAIPERYLHKSHSLRNGGSPPRPGSRPPMPPADFWKFTRAAQQKQNDISEYTETIWPETPTKMRARAQSEDAARRDPIPCRWPLLPASPEKAVLRPNTNKGNTMRVVKKTSYEGLRKGMTAAKEVDYGRLDGHKRKDSRTLVKMRQPWDQEPRGERRRANS